MTNQYDATDKSLAHVLDDLHNQADRILVYHDTSAASMTEWKKLFAILDKAKELVRETDSIIRDMKLAFERGDIYAPNERPYRIVGKHAVSLRPENS